MQVEDIRALAEEGHAIGDTVFLRDGQEAVALITLAGDRQPPWHIRLGMGTRERANELGVAFPHDETADGEHENLVVRDPELAAHGEPIPWTIGHAVRDRLNQLARQSKPRPQVGRGIVGHAHDVRARPKRPAERNAAALLRRDVLAAVHRNDVRNAEPPGRRRPIHRHRELVAVHDFDSAGAQHLDQSADTSPIDRPPDRERLALEPRVSQPGRQPAHSVCRTDGAHVVPPRSQRLRQTDEHRLRAARPIGLQHLSNAQRTRAGGGCHMGGAAIWAASGAAATAPDAWGTERVIGGETTTQSRSERGGDHSTARRRRNRT